MTEETTIETLVVHANGSADIGDERVFMIVLTRPHLDSFLVIFIPKGCSAETGQEILVGERLTLASSTWVLEKVELRAESAAPRALGDVAKYRLTLVRQNHDPARAALYSDFADVVAIFKES